MRKQYRYKRTTRGRFSSAKSHAKYRKIEWALSFEEYAPLVEPNACHYCLSGLSETSVGLDRKDNSKGYIQGNVVPCCPKCNTMKSSHLTYEEMFLAMAIIRAKRKLEKCTE